MDGHPGFGPVISFLIALTRLLMLRLSVQEKTYKKATAYLET
jgi:hypothetical protein